MAVEKEIIIEFNKMLLEHSESLLKVAGGLAIVNLLLIANVRKAGEPHGDINCASLLIAISALTCGLSFIFGYLSNSVVIASMSNYAITGNWTPDSVAELFTLFQLIGLAIAVFAFLFCIFWYRKVMLDALTHVGLAAGG